MEQWIRHIISYEARHFLVDKTPFILANSGENQEALFECPDFQHKLPLLYFITSSENKRKIEQSW
jgi:hypothetical protein